MSIEFKREYRGVGVDERDGSSSLPRKQRFNVLHQKQPSLPGWYSALASQFIKAYNSILPFAMYKIFFTVLLDGPESFEKLTLRSCVLRAKVGFS